MKTTILFGVLAALATGVAIGTQSTISSRIGAVIGPFRTGMLVNFVGGIMAGLLLLGFTAFQGRSVWGIPSSVWGCSSSAARWGSSSSPGCPFPCSSRAWLPGWPPSSWGR